MQQNSNPTITKIEITEEAKCAEKEADSVLLSPRRVVPTKSLPKIPQKSTYYVSRTVPCIDLANRCSVLQMQRTSRSRVTSGDSLPKEISQILLSLRSM